MKPQSQSKLSFEPKYHLQNSDGTWSLKPINPKLVNNLVKDEADKMMEEGLRILVTDLDKPAFRPDFLISED